MRESVKNKSTLASRLLIGSGIFLLIVLYVNFRHNYEMTLIDWAVISLGIIVFIYAVIQKIKEKRNA
jgi:multisubunit Na+/H+ antiporter MnhC subunit